MRFDKLVEMVKRVGRDKLEENNHSTRYKRSKSMSGRYKPGVKLAQEDSEDMSSGKGKEVINLNPTINSIEQSR
jgi:hypothetical protein